MSCSLSISHSLVDEKLKLKTHLPKFTGNTILYYTLAWEQKMFHATLGFLFRQEMQTYLALLLLKLFDWSLRPSTIDYIDVKSVNICLIMSLRVKLLVLC